MEMQIPITMIYNILAPEWLKRKKEPSVDKDGEQLELSHIAGEIVNQYNHYGKNLGSIK